MTLQDRLKNVQKFEDDLNAKKEKPVSIKEKQTDDVVREVEKDEIIEKRKVLENTLISAQKTAEEIIEGIIKNAKTEAVNIKKEAKDKIEDIVLETRDKIKETLRDIEEVGKNIQDNLNQRLNNIYSIYSKLSVVLKIEENEEKLSTSREYVGEEVSEKQVEVKKSEEILEEEQQVEHEPETTGEIKPEDKETNLLI